MGGKLKSNQYVNIVQDDNDYHRRIMMTREWLISYQ